MKTNSTITRLGAFILVCGFAASTAFADATTATRNLIEKQVAARNTKPTAEFIAIRTDHAWLGARVENSHTPADRIHRSAPDVKLAKVYRHTPAYAAGLRTGDVLWKYDGQRLTSTTQLKRELRSEKPGEIVPVEAFHHGKREELKVKLGDMRTTFVPVRAGYLIILG